ncbi:MAG TPA: peptide chain release factor 2 [Candidatus Gracilibacteria bacterium]|nr:peptide chain release factor 2 [Candidatus Gracilibacteria bacterium]
MLLNKNNLGIQNLETYFQKFQTSIKIPPLEEQVQRVDFWEQDNAQSLMQEYQKLKNIEKEWQEIQTEVQNWQEVSSVLDESESEIEFQKLEEKVKNLRLKWVLNEEYDNYFAIINLNSGAGGIDANDWTEMLANMLIKYAQKQEWKVEILDWQEGEIAGIKSASLRISQGELIYGHLKSEQGQHRLVRRSPFNAGHTRETSFASVEVIPEIPAHQSLEIPEKDLRIDTFRAQGAGGQHVNKTDSAIRITHLPTGISVQCQNERSQSQNKAQALKVLASRLAENQRQIEEKKKNSFKNEFRHTSFAGERIRSYVLDDQYVKDERSNFKTTAVNSVLEGNLEEIIESYLFLC